MKRLFILILFTSFSVACMGEDVDEKMQSEIFHNVHTVSVEKLSEMQMRDTEGAKSWKMIKDAATAAATAIAGSEAWAAAKRIASGAGPNTKKALTMPVTTWSG